MRTTRGPINPIRNQGILGVVGASKWVLADIIEVDHSNTTTASSLGIWPASFRTQWCHIVVGNSSHPLLPKGSMWTHRHVCPCSIRHLHAWSPRQWCQDICHHSVWLLVHQGCLCWPMWDQLGMAWLSGYSHGQAINIKLEGVVPGDQGTPHCNLDIDN